MAPGPDEPETRAQGSGGPGTAFPTLSYWDVPAACPHENGGLRNTRGGFRVPPPKGTHFKAHDKVFLRI